MTEVFCWIHVRRQEKAKICRVPARQTGETKIAKEGDPIVLSNCSVKKARSGDSLELIVHDQTQINKSPKKFELDVKKVLVEDTSVSKEVSLSQLKDQVPWQRVTIKAKVLEIGDTS